MSQAPISTDDQASAAHEREDRFAALFGSGRGRVANGNVLTPRQRLRRLVRELERAFARPVRPVPVDDIAYSFGLDLLNEMPLCQVVTLDATADAEEAEVYEPEGLLLTVADAGHPGILGAVVIASGEYASFMLGNDKRGAAVVGLLEL